MVNLKATGATLVGLMSALTSATIQRVCPSNGNGNVCFTIGVPVSSQTAGSGNIYFQIKAPASYAWVALGTGSQMANSNIFLVYRDGVGNVTLSPRRGTQYSMPTLDTSSTAAKLTLLAGSGVKDGVMTANVRCANCQSWSGGTMALNGRSSWIGGWLTSGSLATTSRSASIEQHDQTANFDLDLGTASITTDANPFLGAAVGGSDGFSNVGAGSGASMLIAHGVLMAVVFVLLFPTASMIMPVFGSWKAHAGVQMFNSLLMWVGFGLGVKAASERSMLFTSTHTILGTVVVALLVLQPALGYAHHRHFVRHGRRGAFSYAHIGWGQSLMVLGLVNGGLGLELARAKGQWIVTYAIISAVVFVAYAVVKLFLISKARRAAAAGGGGAARKEAPGTPPSPQGLGRPYY